ncbi:MAG: hypothetical protein HDS38_05890 [Bacteroides sp.]|nr:hypothetical protein [Bacteroides sp.]
MIKLYFIIITTILIYNFNASAQIGYQVSLLNNATGEARSNERVTVTVKITDSEGKTVCEETKNETSNDFGVISMSVGDSDTFANADWSKLPFFIEASVDGRLLGKSQLLSVPVAEYAKRTGPLTIDLLCSKNWVEKEDYDDDDTPDTFIFNKNGSYTYKHAGMDYYHGSYYIEGNEIHYSHIDYNGEEYWGYSILYHPKDKFLYERGSNERYY